MKLRGVGIQMSKSSDFETGVKGMFWMSLMTVVSYLIQLVITYILARLLTPANYGEVAAITILIGFANLFWTMGVGPGIVQKKKLSQEDIITARTLNILFGFIIFMCINIFGEFFVKIFSISNKSMLHIFSFVFILNSLSGVSQSLMQKKCKFKQIAIMKFIALIFYGISAVVLAIMGLQTWALIFAQLVQTLVVTVLFINYEKVGFKLHIYRESAKDLLYYGGGFTISNIFSYIASNGDNFVVNKLMGAVSLGAYSKAYQLLMYPVTLIGETVDQVLFPLLSKSQDDIEKLKRVFVSGTGFIALLSVPISIIAFVCGEHLVRFFLGEKWLSTVMPFKLMVVGLFFRIGYKLSDSLIRALGKVYSRIWIQIIYATLVVTGAFVGHRYGLAGVAVGVTIAFTSNYLLMTALCIFYIRVPLIKIIENIIPSLIMGLISIMALNLINNLKFANMSSLLVCIVTTLYVGGIYCLSFIILKRFIIPEELNEIFFGIKDLLIKKLKR